MEYEYLKYWVKDDFTEPYQSQQNPAEKACLQRKVEQLMIDTGCDPK
jgi:hypothetical protein